MWQLPFCKSLFCQLISQVKTTNRLKSVSRNFYPSWGRIGTTSMAKILGIAPQNTLEETEAEVTHEVEGSLGDGPTTAESQTALKCGDSEVVAENPGVPFYQLSRRARKRIIRNQEREAKREGRAPRPKRRKKDEDRVINFTDEMLHDAEYYIENGLRKVYPYPFNYTTYAKGRWVGQNILEMFGSEFKGYEKATCEKAINAGRMSINGKKVSTDYVFKDNDFVENVVHRHELPVTAAPVKVVLETDDVVVVDKPSSIPVHPCGRFRHNSLTFIIAKELGLKNLRSIYRLDRLTSGVFILCKTDKQTQIMQGHIKNREVQKTYIARVVGEFPSVPLECREPIDILSHKIGLFKVGPNGKESLTEFERISYNGMTSVVLCKPHTGRTHQIRVHLQYLGFPIQNDPLYNTHLWGPTRGKGGEYGKSEEQLVEDILAHHTITRFGIANARKSTDGASATASCEDITTIPETLIETSPASAAPNTDCDTNEDAGTVKSTEQDTAKNIKSTGSDQKDFDDKPTRDSVATVDRGGDNRPRFDAAKVTVDGLCEECTRTYCDPKPEELIMYLHALSYSGPGWKYETELPDWAHVDWVSEPATETK